LLNRLFARFRCKDQDAVGKGAFVLHGVKEVAFFKEFSLAGQKASRAHAHLALYFVAPEGDFEVRIVMDVLLGILLYGLPTLASIS
jgi:hypothetical protein